MVPDVTPETTRPFLSRDCHLAERDGAVTSILHAFEMEVDPDAEPESDPVLKPYSELEDPGSLYISGLAVMKGFRSPGIGAKLKDCAEARAPQVNDFPATAVPAQTRRAGSFYKLAIA